MQHQRNGWDSSRRGNRYSDDQYDNNGNDRNYSRGSGKNDQGYDRGENWDRSRASFNDHGSRDGYRNGRQNDQRSDQQDNYNNRYEDGDYEDVTEGYSNHTGRQYGSQQYGSQYNQQGNRGYGNNGRGYNDLNGGRNDQYDRDRGNNREDDRYRSSRDSRSNNGYNSFDQYADRGNYNTARNGSGGYGSTSNRYDGDGSSHEQGRMRSDEYDSWNSGTNGNNRQQGQNGNSRQRSSKQGFGSMSNERRRSFTGSGGRHPRENNNR